MLPNDEASAERAILHFKRDELNYDEYAKLYAEKERFRVMVENARDVIFCLSPEGIFICLNRAFALNTGWSANEWLGKEFTQLVHPDDVMRALQRVHQALQGNELPMFQLHILARDGSLQSVEITLTPLREQERIVGVLGTARDVSERKRTEDRRATLYRATQEINASIDREQICAALHRAAAQVMPVDAFVIALLVEQGTMVEDLYLVDNGQRFPGERYPLGSGLTSYVIKSKAPFICADLNEPQAVAQTGAIDFGVELEKPIAVLAVPLQTATQVIGMISAQAYAPQVYTIDDLELLQVLAAYGAIALENARLYEEIKHLSILDELTGVYNRRGLFELGDRALLRAAQSNAPLSAIMLDLDHFKQVNDRYGHLIGDRVLQRVAEVCRNTLREADIIGRYGGEEFVILLPNTDRANAEQIANRLCAMFPTTAMETPRGTLYVTVSFGVAQDQDNLGTLAALIDRSDHALYEAKKAGRNCVRVL